MAGQLYGEIEVDGLNKRDVEWIIKLLYSLKIRSNIIKNTTIYEQRKTLVNDMKSSDWGQGLLCQRQDTKFSKQL